MVYGNVGLSVDEDYIFLEVMDGEVTKEYQIATQEYLDEVSNFKETGQMRNKELKKIYDEYEKYIDIFKR